MVEKTIELTGISANSIEDAVNLAVARASATIQGIRYIKVLDVIGLVESGGVSQWRVKIALSFAVDDRLHE